MLQQTQVVTVVPFFLRWMERFPNLADLAEAAEDEVLRLWQGLGYYSRARNLHRAAKLVLDRFGGELPSDPALLVSLPGVGPYAAGAIASFAFDRPAPAVDANIARVLARLANVSLPIDSPAGNRLIWGLASTLLPEQTGGRLHTSALMELGALICLPKKPQCLVCPVRSFCRAKDPESLPKKAPRRSTIQRREDAAWIQSEQGVLLERQTGRRSAGLWSLPKLEFPPSSEALFQTVYPFTHHKVTLQVHAAPPPAVLSAEQRWFAPERILDEAALPTGHRRAVAALLRTQTVDLTAQMPTPHTTADGTLPPATVADRTSPFL